MENILTSREVAKMAGITVGAVNRLASRGTLPYAWIGRARAFRRDQVQRWLDDSKAQSRRLMRKGAK